MILIKRSIIAMGTYLRSRAFAVSVLAVVLSCSIYYMTVTTNAISIRDGNEQPDYIFTNKTEARDILAEQGIETLPTDKIDFMGVSGQYGEISITRSFPVTIQADGKMGSYFVLGGTVAEAIQSAGIPLGDDDIVNLDLDAEVKKDDNIVINRVEYKTYSKTETVEYKVIDKLSPLIRKGRSKLLSEGSNGKKELLVEEKYIDGKLKETNIIEEYTIVEAVDQVMLRGAKVAASPMTAFAGYELDENGVPKNYKKVLSNQVATAYSAAKKGMWGSSGLPAVTGYVAVDPTVIPYGTKLYIATPDNSFVYGYCIAGDTGTGLVEGVIDVDLMFDSYRESCLFGKKKVNIYILE